MEVNLSYDQLNNEYSMLMSVLGASVSKHLIDEHYTCIWANDYYYELIRYPKPEYEALFNNQCDKYFFNNPEGWRLLTEKIASAQEMQEKRYTIFLPMLYPDGERFWVKLQSVFTNEYIDGYPVAYTTMTDVTEMVRARQEQEYTQQVFEKVTQEQKMLMEALNVSVSKHLIDEHFTCVWANEHYYKLIGYPKTRYEELFHNHADAYYQNNTEGWELLCRKVQSVLERGEDQYEMIVPMKYEDGSSYWVKLFSYFTDEYINGIRTSYTVMTDVTELVQMKNEQEMLMRAMKVSVSRHLVDEHFTVLWANDFYYELIGYSKLEYEALFHNHCDEYFLHNQGSWSAIHDKISQMSEAGEKSYEVFIPLKIPDGSTCWVKMVGFFTDICQDGKQLAYTTMVDVTDMIQIQQEKTIAYENIPGFIVKYRILWDKAMMIEASDRITEIFDVDMGRLSSLDSYSVLRPESRAMLEANHSNFRRREPFEGSIRVKDKYGRDRWFQIHCTCIDFVADDPVYLTVFIDITDITELRVLQGKLEERTVMLNTALEEAKQANAAKSDFLSRMSHDIRTPMNVIAGMTEIASSHLSEPERTKDCLQKIRLSSHHLLGLINDVLDMSKIENGNFHINTLPISLPAVLREVIMITLAGIREKGQVFDVHLMNLEDEQFCSDALRLRQILLNLLSNACKFTPVSGRVVFEVEQMVAEQKSKQKGMGRMTALRFPVSDTGAGMSQEFLEHIFEAFTREQDSRTDQIEGSGLGMCITKRLVDMMDGTITVKSQPGKGTSFQVTLPMKVVPEKGGNAIWEEGSNAIDGVHILLADHDPVVLTHGCQALTALGVEAECAGSGEEAAAMVLSRHREGRDFSMVILDADLSEPNWLETARRIRNAGANGQPCLIISAFDWNDRKEEAIKAGICGFVEKPLFHSALENCIMEHLNGKAQPVHQPLTFDFSGRTFLLVEDNELNREIALELLGNLGASLETAVNGEEAVNRFKESPPGFYSLILMDIQMPVMNGYEAARAIRSLGRADAVSVPIIAMTADAFVEDIQNSKAAGMNGHMAKPLDYEGMSREISKYLNNDYKRREDFYE